MFKNKSTLILISIAALVVIVSISIAAISIFKPEVMKGFFQKPYYVVYLTTGEIYVGRLSYFPKMEMTDIYLLQTVRDPKDETKGGFQLAPLKDAIWSPKKIYLNSNQVVFSGPVDENSEVAKTLNAAVLKNTPAQ
jgi:hypothetical protein